MKSFFLVILILISLYLLYKLSKRMLYKAGRKTPFKVFEGNPEIKRISMDFRPIYYFKDGDTLYLTSESGMSSKIHRLGNNTFDNILEFDKKLIATPAKDNKKLCCLFTDRINYFISNDKIWEADIMKSRISNPKISPFIDDKFIYFPESDLIINKRRSNSISAEQMPSIKRFDINDGRIDMSLPLSYAKSRYGIISGCDTNLVFDGDYFYIGLQTGYLLKIESKTFIPAWSLKLPKTSQDAFKKRTDFDYDPITDEKHVYIGYNGNLLQIEKNSSDIRNRMPYYQDPGSLVFSGNYGYFSSMGSIYRFDKDKFSPESYIQLRKKFVFLVNFDETRIAALATNRRPTTKKLFSRYDAFLYIIDTVNRKNLLELRIHNIGYPALIKMDERLIVFTEDEKILSVGI